MEIKWNITRKKLPTENKKVIGYDNKRGLTICSYMKHDNYPNKQLWIVNGSSGGIGTDREVKRPTYWMDIPLPNVGDSICENFIEPNFCGL